MNGNGEGEKKTGSHGTGTEITEAITFDSTAWEEDGVKKPEMLFSKKILVS
jgi:hypothetical protein